MGKHEAKNTLKEQLEQLRDWLNWLFQYEHRRQLYQVAKLVGPILVAYGLIGEEQLSTILGALLMFAGNGVASWNTPKGGRMLPDGGVRVPRPGTVPVEVEPIGVLTDPTEVHEVTINEQ